MKTVGRRMITRQVTKTTIKLAKMEMRDGKPVAIALPDIVVIGNVQLPKAQRMVDKKYDEPVTVLEVQADTETYELPISEFIKVAKVKKEEQED